MRLRDLKLRNFRSHVRTHLPLSEPLTFVVGSNASGKSSVPDAIAWLLTGRCRGTTEAGAGAGRLVNREASSMGVEATIEAPGGAFTLQRLLHGTGDGGRQEIFINGNATRIGEAEAYIQQAIAVPAHRIRPSLYSEQIFGMHHAEAKTLLLELLAVRVQYQGAELTIPQLEKLYLEAFEQRKLAKRERDAFKLPALSWGGQDYTREEFEALVSDADAGGLEAQLEDLRTQLSDLEREQAAAKGAQAGAADATAATYARARKKLDDLRATAEALDEQIEKLEAERPIAKAEEELAIAAAKVRDIEQAIEHLSKTDGDQKIALADAQGRLRTITPLADRIALHTPKSGCVLSAEIECGTPAKAFKGELEKLRTEIASLQTITQTAENHASEKRKKAEQLAEAKKAHDEIDAYIEERSRLANARLAAAGAVQEATRELVALPLPPKPAPAAENPIAAIAPDPYAPPIAALKERIAAGAQTVKEAQRIAFIWQQYTDARSRQVDLDDRVKELEALCQQLGPNGIRAEALRAKLEEFEAAINEALALFGYEMRFQIEPWRILVNGIEHDLLAESEQIRAGAAFALAVADYTGLRFVCIDRVDALLSEPRGILADLIMAWEGGQAILLASKESDFEPDPVEGLGYAVLSGGAGTPTSARVLEPVR